MKIVVRSPTRVDFAGGTLDLWPLFNFVSEAKTINAAIDIYTRVELVIHDSPQIEIEIENVNFKKNFKDLKEVLKCKNKNLNILNPILKYFAPQFGFHLKTSSQSPIGAGLGGSSSLIISIIKAFCEATKKEMTVYELVELAHNIESHILRTPTGTQDYIPPIMGGINLIHYNYDGIKIEKLSQPRDSLNLRFLLVYTGKPHHSGFNNWEVLKKCIEGHKPTLKHLKGLRDVACDLLKQIRTGNWELKSLLRREYRHRTAISKAFDSKEIRRLEKIALKNGAESIKICGAGGGGCVIVWCHPDKKEKVKSACQKAGFQVLKAKIVEQGSLVTSQV